MYLQRQVAVSAIPSNTIMRIFCSPGVDESSSTEVEHSLESPPRRFSRVPVSDEGGEGELEDVGVYAAHDKVDLVPVEVAVAGGGPGQVVSDRGVAAQP